MSDGEFEIEDEDVEMIDDDMGGEDLDEDMEEEEEVEFDGGEDDDILVDDSMFDSSFSKVQKVSKKSRVVDVMKLIAEQADKIKDISEALNITYGVAGNLLKYFKWDNERLYNAFFEDKDKLCSKAGVKITNIPFYVSKKKLTCPICWDDWKKGQMYALPCNHFFCAPCWQEYLKVSIQDGPVCLLTKCPYRGCGNIIDEELVKKLVVAQDYKLYRRYLIRSFVDDNPKIKWCPAADCGKAVWCPDSAEDNVICECGQKFCFKCQLEAHEPCTCQKLMAWKLKEKDESETANWLVVNTKICPGCKKAIEKNGGCNHMSCGQCKHEFCWICMDPWSEHGSKTGGFYKCNKYNENQLKDKLGTGKINQARAELEKYMHYFKRYANHLNSQKFETELKKKSEKKMKKLQLKHKYSSWSDVEYISKAINQLLDARNCLKYTYIHAFYIKDGSEKNLFEFLQEDLERETERLSGLLEADVDNFDRDQILNSTKSSRTRLKNLLEGTKSGLTSEI